MPRCPAELSTGISVDGVRIPIGRAKANRRERRGPGLIARFIQDARRRLEPSMPQGVQDSKEPRISALPMNRFQADALELRGNPKVALERKNPAEALNLYSSVEVG